MPRPCAPLALRRIPQEIAHAIGALAGGRFWHAEGDTWSRFELHWQPPAPPPRWHLRSGAGLLGLTDITLLQLGSGIRLDPDWTQDAFDDAAHLACACLDHTLARALGGPLQWQEGGQAAESGAPAAPEVPGIALRLVMLPAQGEERFALTLCMAGDVLAALLRDAQWQPLPLAPAAPWMDSLSCDAHLCVASVRVPVLQLRSLGPGDLVVLCELSRGVRGVSSLQLGRILAEIEAQPDAPDGQHAYRSWRWAEARPQAQGNPMTDLAADENLPVDSVEVTLEVICGRTKLSIGALRALRPGSLLQMDCPAAAHVELLVGGVRVGTGELVQVDGWLAVEVRQLVSA